MAARSQVYYCNQIVWLYIIFQLLNTRAHTGKQPWSIFACDRISVTIVFEEILTGYVRARVYIHSTGNYVICRTANEQAVKLFLFKWNKLERIYN